MDVLSNGTLMHVSNKGHTALMSHHRGALFVLFTNDLSPAAGGSRVKPCRASFSSAATLPMCRPAKMEARAVSAKARERVRQGPAEGEGSSPEGTVRATLRLTTFTPRGRGRQHNAVDSPAATGAL